MSDMGIDYFGAGLLGDKLFRALASEQIKQDRKRFDSLEILKDALCQRRIKSSRIHPDERSPRTTALEKKSASLTRTVKSLFSPITVRSAPGPFYKKA
jgi:hypothetical protein